MAELRKIPGNGLVMTQEDIVSRDQVANVYDFGATGDGQTDDSSAIQAAAIHARDTNKVLYIPPDTYRINKTVVLQCNVSAVAATFTVNDNTITAIQYGSNTTYLKNFNSTLPSVIQLQKASQGWGEGDVGIKIINIGESIINIQRITHFSTGVWLSASNGNGLTYNTFTFEWLGNNKTNLLLLQDDDTGWVNQNTFIGGRFSHSSAGEGDEVSGVRQIALLCRPTTETSVPDNNQFYGVSLEGNAPEYHIECVGNHNLWSNCRFETTAPVLPKIYWRNISGRVAHANKIIGGSFSDDIVYTEDEGVHSNQTWGSRKMVLDGRGGASGELVIRNSTAGDRPAISIVDETTNPLVSSAASLYTIQQTARYYRGKRKTDTNPRVTIDNYNATIQFGNGVDAPDVLLQRWGATVIRFSNQVLATNYRATSNGGLVNDNSGFNAFVNVSDNGTVISRNRADSHPTLRIDSIHAESSGDIAEFLSEGIKVASVDKQGVVSSSGYKVGSDEGASGTFISQDGKTVTVTSGIITDIE